ncbi:hypothetical protein MA16_Dca027055 [Dendrobium catenatum]|uniref:Uncharacterized protein n=1 Tax=Dendrobium catenatum TaxID=906689 RepID=A0A2I0WRJ0_9ASPA|nr:hypothetical protein MA16_Dca027055 [Dendrobium catenatum]
MSDESSTCEDEQMLNCYFDKDLKENYGLRGDCTDCRITKELMRDNKECFLKQLEWKEEDFDIKEKD